MESPQALDDAGFLDLLAPGAVVAVEWADRFPEALPGDRIDLELARGDSGGGASEADDPVAPRVVSARARGPRARALLERWESRWAAARDRGH